jgi:hypothetical protein
LAVLEGNENQGPPREIHDNQGFEGQCLDWWCLFVNVIMYLYLYLQFWEDKFRLLVSNLSFLCGESKRNASPQMEPYLCNILCMNWLSVTFTLHHYDNCHELGLNVLLPLIKRR